MTTITTNRGSGENRPVREGRARRAGLLMLLPVSASLLLAACGASSGGPSTASNQAVGGGGSDASQAAASNQLVRFAQCMRANGVPNFPDPVNGRLLLQAGPGSNLNPSSPAFQTASQACKSLAPSGTVGAAQSAQGSGKAVLFAQCMRSHGVPNFPDPKEGPGGTFQLTLPNGVDPSSPQFQAAQQACQSLSPLPSSGGAP